MTSIPRRVETMGADVLPAPDNIPGIKYYVEQFNTVRKKLDYFSGILKGFAENKDKILESARRQYVDPNRYRLTYEQYVKNLNTYVPAYFKADRALNRLKHLVIIPDNLRTSYPEAYKYVQETAYFAPIKDAILKYEQAFIEFKATLEEIAMENRQSWPSPIIFSLSIPIARLEHVEDTPDFVETVNVSQQQQRQKLGVTVTEWELPRFDVGVYEKNKWLLPVLVGGGALATILALKG